MLILVCSTSLTVKLGENISANLVYLNRNTIRNVFCISKAIWVLQNRWIYWLKLAKVAIWIIKVLAFELKATAANSSFSTSSTHFIVNRV